MKRCQKIWAVPSPPPSFGQNPKEQLLFFVKPSLRNYKFCHWGPPMRNMEVPLLSLWNHFSRIVRIVRIAPKWWFILRGEATATSSHPFYFKWSSNCCRFAVRNKNFKLYLCTQKKTEVPRLPCTVYVMGLMRFVHVCHVWPLLFSLRHCPLFFSFSS